MANPENGRTYAARLSIARGADRGLPPIHLRAYIPVTEIGNPVPGPP